VILYAEDPFADTYGHECKEATQATVEEVSLGDIKVSPPRLLSFFFITHSHPHPEDAGRPLLYLCFSSSSTLAVDAKHFINNHLSIFFLIL